jgi:hypothetical protein
VNANSCPSQGIVSTVPFFQVSRHGRHQRCSGKTPHQKIVVAKKNGAPALAILCLREIA